MNTFYYRTESIKKEDLLKLYVGNNSENIILDAFKNQQHSILEGSRGSGKSFLMQVAKEQLLNNFDTLKIFPVYITFMQSALIHSPTPNQFHFWMMAKIMKATLKALRKKGLIVNLYANSLLGGTQENLLQKLIKEFETSYRNPNKVIEPQVLPDMMDLHDAIEEICQENDINYFVYFFDEAAHVFRPEQQRQFFTLFRDFKTPYISCNAAVYPGVTHYGKSFELTHDATLHKIERDIRSSEYLEEMKEIVLKQGGEVWKKKIDKQSDLFNTLAIASGGNPRLLLKTLHECDKLNTSNVNTVIRKFYRSEIWNEHTQLGEKYQGHKPLIDWGRKFLEDNVIPNIVKKNKEKETRVTPKSTIYFWIEKDAPQHIKEALRLLSYTGIIKKTDSGVKGTGSIIGDRYQVKFGCIISQASAPTTASKSIMNNLQIDYFVVYGRNNQAYKELKVEDITSFSNEEYLQNLKKHLSKPITDLELTKWQISKIKEVKITTLEQLLDTDEEYLIEELRYIGVKRARIIKNAAIAELLETISG